MRHRSATSAALTVCLAAFLAAPALAQEEAPAEVETNRIGNFYINLEAWVAQPTGLQYVPATTLDGTLADALELDHGTSSDTRYEFEWQLPKSFGTVRGSVYKHNDDETLQLLSPSEFVYGQLLTHPYLAGVGNDGRADGFAARANTRVRDLRFEFRRRAFRSPRVEADWFVGWRRVEHSRSHAAEYYALVPDIPPLLPPGGSCTIPCALDYRPDIGSVDSSFEGRGGTIGVELEFPIWKNRVVFEADLSVSVLRGDMETSYTSTNSAYLLNCGGLPTGTAGCDSGEEFVLLNPPYDEFDDVIDSEPGDPFPLLPFISQIDVPIGLTTDLSTTSQVYDATLGFRWRTPYKRLEVYAGIRQSHYDGVGADVRPVVSTIALSEEGEFLYNLQDMQRVDRSVTYEGFFGGLRFRLY
jgi:hypothetical protein